MLFHSYIVGSFFRNRIHAMEINEQNTFLQILSLNFSTGHSEPLINLHQLLTLARENLREKRNERPGSILAGYVVMKAHTVSNCFYFYMNEKSFF